MVSIRNGLEFLASSFNELDVLEFLASSLMNWTASPGLLDLTFDEFAGLLDLTSTMTSIHNRLKFFDGFTFLDGFEFLGGFYGLE